MEKIKNWVTYAMDVYAIIMIACILLKTKNNLHERNIIVLDHYFNQIEAILWPKLESLFQKINLQFKEENLKIMRQV